jgi:hypothetical protein
VPNAKSVAQRPFRLIDAAVAEPPHRARAWRRRLMPAKPA